MPPGFEMEVPERYGEAGRSRGRLRHPSDKIGYSPTGRVGRLTGHADGRPEQPIDETRRPARAALAYAGVREPPVVSIRSTWSATSAAKRLAVAASFSDTREPVA